MGSCVIPTSTKSKKDASRKIVSVTAIIKKSDPVDVTLKVGRMNVLMLARFPVKPRRSTKPSSKRYTRTRTIGFALTVNIS
jgi:hypothetical protein